jgi:2,4-dienoyl-CoA reductase-like NADH-dependent reductase (Old Yellow Enzyme family)
MVHEEIRKQVGDGFVVGIRYAAEDGVTFEDSVELVRILQQSGLFDLFDVIFGPMDTPSSLMTYQIRACATIF